MYVCPLVGDTFEFALPLNVSVQQSSSMSISYFIEIVYFVKVYFPKVYFPKVYFPKLYFLKVYFLKVYFQKVFLKVYFSKCIFRKCIVWKQIFRKFFFWKYFWKCIFWKCIFRKLFWPKAYLAQTFSNRPYPVKCVSSELLRACSLQKCINFGGRRLPLYQQVLYFVMTINCFVWNCVSVNVGHSIKGNILLGSTQLGRITRSA